LHPGWFRGSLRRDRRLRQTDREMNLFSGILYNFKGLRLAIKTPRLLLLGLLRLAAVIIITVILSTFVFYYHNELLNLLWSRPESKWLIWLWYVVSWLLSLMLAGLSAIFAYLVAQILFSVLVMDLMSRITESLVTGRVRESRKMPMLRMLFYLIRQEIPRAVFPVTLSLLPMILGWVTPLGPVLTLVSAAIAAIFLAWDNTDLIPARRLEPFGKRFNSLLKNLPFHLGFGLPFLIPILNILFLSFAPVGATLYFIDKYDRPKEK
jgi:CysZ protein